MLSGIRVKQLKRFNDERGFFAEVYRQDWKEFFEEDTPAQSNISLTYPGVIRAWHRHVRGQNDYFVVLNGILKICAYDEKTRELDEIISSGRDMQMVRMPGHYWHGFKAVGNKPATLLYFTTKLYDYENPDEERRPWNDPSVVPKIIGTNRKDPRTGMPWDWNYPPHK